jgi:hypothetical protein
MMIATNCGCNTLRTGNSDPRASIIIFRATVAELKAFQTVETTPRLRLWWIVPVDHFPLGQVHGVGPSAVHAFPFMRLPKVYSPP